QSRRLRIVNDDRMGDLISVHQLLKLVLRYCFAVPGGELVLQEHEQENSAKDRDPDDPRSAGNSVLGCDYRGRRWLRAQLVRLGHAGRISTRAAPPQSFV